jgi:hypothetical protein
MSDHDRLTTALADRYRIERELGRGGMATVSLAEDLKHHRPVALKVLRPELAAALGPDRFLREIELSARLTHPHSLPLHDDSGNADGFLFYANPQIGGVGHGAQGGHSVPPARRTHPLARRSCHDGTTVRTVVLEQEIGERWTGDSLLLPLL